MTEWDSIWQGLYHTTQTSTYGTSSDVKVTVPTPPKDRVSR